MFSKIFVPVSIKEIELSVGILPYVSSMARKLGIPVVLASILDPDNLDIPPEAVQDDIHYREGMPSVNAPGMIDHMGPDKPVLEEVSSRPSGAESGETLTSIMESFEFEVKRRLNRIAAPLREDGIDVEFIASTSPDTSDEILRLVEKEGCDLIAMATHDRNLLGQAIKGSVTNEVARSSDVPVLAIAPKDGKAVQEQGADISRIIVPLDGTSFSEAALPYVEELAQKMSLEAVIVRVIAFKDVYPTTSATPISPTPPVAAQATGGLYTIAENEAIDYLKAITERLSSKGIKARWELLRGAPSGSIADAVKDASGSMVALASHGRSGVSRWAIGSVAEELIHSTGEPVLVIPATVAE
jgi:nucleotide-binding universal stress UspA family protein